MEIPKKITIVTNYDDWEGLYFDGKLVDQGHQITVEDLLKSLEIPFKTVEVDNEWFFEKSVLPKELKDVKLV